MRPLELDVCGHPMHNYEIACRMHDAQRAASAARQVAIAVFYHHEMTSRVTLRLANGRQRGRAQVGQCQHRLTFTEAVHVRPKLLFVEPREFAGHEHPQFCRACLLLTALPSTLIAQYQRARNSLQLLRGALNLSDKT